MPPIPALRPILAASALALATTPALADIGLPAPYVSRALDAVLLPIDDGVRVAFDLWTDDTGVLVLATEPGGLADANGIVPGDVLAVVGGRRISRPVDVDAVVYHWIVEGVLDFTFDVYRAGASVEVYALISEEEYWEVIEVTSIKSWSSWTTETSFSYEEFYSEYSETITESYESSETIIEETVTSEEFTAEMSEEVPDEEFAEETYEDVTAEEAMAADGTATEEEFAEEEFAEKMTGDEGFADEEFAGEEDFAEADVVEDDYVEEEAVEEDYAEEVADDGDFGGDEGGEE